MEVEESEEKVFVDLDGLARSGGADSAGEADCRFVVVSPTTATVPDEEEVGMPPSDLVAAKLELEEDVVVKQEVLQEDTTTAVEEHQYQQQQQTRSTEEYHYQQPQQETQEEVEESLASPLTLLTQLGTFADLKQEFDGYDLVQSADWEEEEEEVKEEKDSWGGDVVIIEEERFKKEAVEEESTAAEKVEDSDPLRCPAPQEKRVGVGDLLSAMGKKFSMDTTDYVRKKPTKASKLGRHTSEKRLFISTAHSPVLMRDATRLCAPPPAPTSAPSKTPNLNVSKVLSAMGSKFSLEPAVVLKDIKQKLKKTKRIGRLKNHKII